MKRTHADTILSMPRLIQIFGMMLTAQIKPEHITDVVSLRQDKKRANQKDIHYLQGLIAWMVKNSHGDPLSFKPETAKYQRPLPTVPTSTDVDSVLLYISDPMTRALIYLMWTTGARISTYAGPKIISRCNVSPAQTKRLGIPEREDRQAPHEYKEDPRHRLTQGRVALGHKDIHTTTIYTQVQTSRIMDAQVLISLMRQPTKKTVDPA